jgi:hypothetical protein
VDLNDGIGDEDDGGDAGDRDNDCCANSWLASIGVTQWRSSSWIPHLGVPAPSSPAGCWRARAPALPRRWSLRRRYASVDPPRLGSVADIADADRVAPASMCSTTSSALVIPLALMGQGVIWTRGPGEQKACRCHHQQYRECCERVGIAHDKCLSAHDISQSDDCLMLCGRDITDAVA